MFKQNHSSHESLSLRSCKVVAQWIVLREFSIDKNWKERLWQFSFTGHQFQSMVYYSTLWSSAKNILHNWKKELKPSIRSTLGSNDFMPEIATNRVSALLIGPAIVLKPPIDRDNMRRSNRAQSQNCKDKRPLMLSWGTRFEGNLEFGPRMPRELISEDVDFLSSFAVSESHWTFAKSRCFSRRRIFSSSWRRRHGQ